MKKRLFALLLLLVSSLIVYSQEKEEYELDCIVLDQYNTYKGKILKESDDYIQILTLEGKTKDIKKSDIDLRYKEVANINFDMFKDKTIPYRDPAVSTFMSCIIPGTGQMYNYEYSKGVLFMIWHYASSISLGYSLGHKYWESDNIGQVTFLYASGISCFASWLISMADANRISKKINIENRFGVKLSSIQITPDIQPIYNLYNSENKISYGLSMQLKF